MNTDNLSSAIDLANGASADLNRVMLHTMQEMADKIDQLERRLRDLEDDYDNGKPGDRDDSDFQARVLEVLDVRSGSCREALGLDDDNIARRALETIMDNSYTVFTHIEAEIEEKLDAMTQGYAFAEAVKEAVEDCIVQTVEELIEERISADLLGADAEDVVRKGLRHLI